MAVNLESGQVYSSYCSCLQRNTGRCCHVACLLYMLEEVNLDLTAKLFQTTTSIGQKWGGIGATTNKDPGPIGM